MTKPWKRRGKRGFQPCHFLRMDENNAKTWISAYQDLENRDLAEPLSIAGSPSYTDGEQRGGLCISVIGGVHAGNY
ncbi:hypothetical protein B0X71_07805 [Planococcus lenghuensis]|uniref:Uncharacterized protein n=1 Tax=Planococcus lenghuensis TaxID=2213202 RepID=A0A1Q2KY23_9BACL|nr:hypothetical protein B0X71_07805 [Planococcus lenghuensis]